VINGTAGISHESKWLTLEDKLGRKR